MALFMDRHDLPDATAADLAAAHLRDLEVQGEFGVRFVTYWFEEEAGSGFCLIEGPDAESVEAAHRAAHGMVPSAVIEVDQASVRGFFGRLNTHPPGEPYTESAFRSILFTDIVDSTRMTQQLGDQAAMRLLREHDGIVRGALARFGGNEVKHTGDGIMAAFDNVADAVHAAADIQWHFDTYNRDAAESLSVRIGIHAGEPVANHDDLFGATVHLASRLCREAEANGIIVSGFVREMCGLGAECYVPLGERRLKGFADLVPIFRLEWRKLSSPRRV